MEKFKQSRSIEFLGPRGGLNHGLTMGRTVEHYEEKLCVISLVMKCDPKNGYKYTTETFILPIEAEEGHVLHRAKKIDLIDLWGMQCYLPFKSKVNSPGLSEKGFIEHNAKIVDDVLRSVVVRKSGSERSCKECAAIEINLSSLLGRLGRRPIKQEQEDRPTLHCNIT